VKILFVLKIPVLGNQCGDFYAPFGQKKKKAACLKRKRSKCLKMLRLKKFDAPEKIALIFQTKTFSFAG